MFPTVLLDLLSDVQMESMPTLSRPDRHEILAKYCSFAYMEHLIKLLLPCQIAGCIAFLHFHFMWNKYTAFFARMEGPSRNSGGLMCWCFVVSCSMHLAG